MTHLIEEKNEEENKNKTRKKEREKEEEKKGELEIESSRRRGIESKNCHASLSHPVLPPRPVLGPSIPKESNIEDLIGENSY